MSAFKYQWNQTIDVGTAGLSKQWTSIRHILSLLVTANACVHVTAYVAVRRSLSTTYTAVVLGLLLRQYVSYQFGVWAGCRYHSKIDVNIISIVHWKRKIVQPTTLLSPETPQVVVMTIHGASSDDKAIKLTIPCLLWEKKNNYIIIRQRNYPSMIK